MCCDIKKGKSGCLYLSMSIQPSLSVRTSILPENMARSMLSCFVRVARNANRFQIFLEPDWAGFRFEFGFRMAQNGCLEGFPGSLEKLVFRNPWRFDTDPGICTTGLLRIRILLFSLVTFKYQLKVGFFAFYLHLHQSKRQQVIKKS